MVLPADLVGGKQVSGSIVDDTHYIRLRPELIVENITLPLDPGGNAAKLSGWRIEVAGSQAATRGQSFHLHGSERSIDHRGQDLPRRTAGPGCDQINTGAQIPPPSSKPKSGYVAQPVCVAGDVCPIGGVFDGNATSALAAFDSTPAKIVAETTDMAFVSVPDDAVYVKQLLFNEGNELLAFPVVVVQMEIVSDGLTLDDFQRDVKKDEHKLIFAGVIGVQTLPEDDWTAGNVSQDQSGVGAPLRSRLQGSAREPCSARRARDDGETGAAVERRESSRERERGEAGIHCLFLEKQRRRMWARGASRRGRLSYCR